VRRALLLVPFLLAGAALGFAQSVPTPPRFEVGVRPDTVTVGDRFLVVLGVSAAPGVRVELPARLDSTADLHPAGERIDRADTAALRETAGYPMVAWRPGAPVPAFAQVRVTYPDGAVATLRVPVRLPFVRSVLPADTALVVPRGPKDVIGPGRDLRLLAALVLLALLLLAPSALLARRLLRRRVARRRGAPPGDPRARALAALDHARRTGLVERGEWKEFYTLTSDALRGYLDALSPRWSADLTSFELTRALDEAGVDRGPAEVVRSLLAEADAVKFAGVQSTAGEAERHWRRVREWVASFDPGDAARVEEVAG